MQKKLIAVFGIGVLLMACVTEQQKKQSSTNPSEESMGVVTYSQEELDIVNLLLKTLNKDGGTLLVAGSLQISSRWKKSATEFVIECSEFIKKQYPAIDEELLQNFINSNSKRMILDIDTIFDTHFIWDEKFMEETDVKGPSIYEVISKKIPDFIARVSMSRVGFNTQKDKALIYMGIRKNAWSGHGDYLVLEKKNDTWEIVKIIENWVS